MNKVKELRIQKKISQGQLANKIGVANNTLSQYESGKRAIPDDIKIKLVEIFNVSMDYLLGLEVPHKKIGFKIPVLGVIPAGVPIETVEDILDWEEIDQELAKTGSFFALKVKGDSMAPQLLENDIIIVKQQENADNGDVCVVMVNGQDATIKRIKHDTTGITLLPNNPTYNPAYYSNKEIESLPIKILGKAIEIRRSL